MKKIIWRCDDFGSATGANAGILQLARLGLPINVSVMIVGPATRAGIEELAALGPHVCLGIHSAITSEWAEVKWGPVGKATRSTRLVDGQGNFHPGAEGASVEAPEAIAAEVEAQIELAKQWGLPFSYLDEHMCFAWMAPAIEPHLVRLAAKHGLVFNRDLPWLAVPTDPGVALVERLRQAVKATPDDVPHVAVFHPAVNDDSMKRLFLEGGPPGQVGAERQQELDTFTSDDWRKLATGGDVQLITYRDL